MTAESVWREDAMSLVSLIMPKGPSGFGYGSTAAEVTENLPLAGKTFVITGCNSGLGFEAMRVLALRGAHVIGAARTLAKATAACESVSGQTTAVACELADPASVRACIATLTTGARPSIDAIICNAGIMALPTLKQAFGYELQFFTNHIGHFMLVTGLLDALSDDGRVVVLSSSAHQQFAPKEGVQFDNLSGAQGYRPWAAYGQSKFANLLFAKELARRLAGTGKTANAVHPGVIRTNLGRNVGMPAALEKLMYGVGDALFLKSVAQGAATECYVATSPAAGQVSGAYFADCNIKAPRADSDDPTLARKLWEVSTEIVARLP
jgi:NAD(P)-dependent dehydrogenase (short-subunit alcohol dehydrogenase family)